MMIKLFILFLLYSNFSFADESIKHRGLFVKVLTPSVIIIKEDKKTITAKLTDVNEKNMSKAEKQKTVQLLKEKLTGQVLIWVETKDGFDISINGVNKISDLIKSKSPK